VYRDSRRPGFARNCQHPGEQGESEGLVRYILAIAHLQVIGGWLVGQLSAGHNVEISVALLNAIIDVYADETRSYDTVFVSEGYLDVLASNVGRIRGEVRKIDRRKDLRLRAVAEEVYENLTAFIKYRRALRR
jgi:hypothetical protein